MIAAEQKFAKELNRDIGTVEAEVLATLAGAKVQQSIIDAMARPAEAPSRGRTTGRSSSPTSASTTASRSIATTANCSTRWQEFGVPPEIIVAIIGVETSYGRTRQVPRPRCAVTLAFHYPPRADFFRGELGQLFLLGDTHLAYPIDELKAPTPARWAGDSSCRPASRSGRATTTATDASICGLRCRTSSRASPTISRAWLEAGKPVAVRAHSAENARETRNRRTRSRSIPMQQMAPGATRPCMSMRKPPRLRLLKLEGETAPRYWLTFHNFYVISRYNRSPLYSMAVWQLAERNRRASGASRRREKPWCLLCSRYSRWRLRLTRPRDRSHARAPPTTNRRFKRPRLDTARRNLLPQSERYRQDATTARGTAGFRRRQARRTSAEA